MTEQQILIYQNDGKAQIQVNLTKDSVWLNLQQIADLFERDKSVISRHLKNIFESDELCRNAVVAKNATTATDNKVYQVEYFNIDAIISVGYRVNSKKSTQIHIWSTQALKDHLLKGYSLNQQRFEQNAAELEQALVLVRKAICSQDINLQSSHGLVDIISRYAQTFLWLQRYDEGLLEEPEGKQGGIVISPNQAMQVLNQLKKQLMDKGEATELFAKPRGDGLAALLGNLQQTAFGSEVYPTIESKAAHLLYFIVKNHPFTDGNKRSAAFLFVDFLYRNHQLFNNKGEPIINDTGLAALTLLVAESAPQQKDILIRLIMNLLVHQVV